VEVVLQVVHHCARLPRAACSLHVAPGGVKLAEAKHKGAGGYVNALLRTRRADKQLGLPLAEVVEGSVASSLFHRLDTSSHDDCLVDEAAQQPS